MSKIIEFLYRDGGNYKWNFRAKISDKKFKKLEKKHGKLELNTELSYKKDLGISRENFHLERGYPYDSEIDHDLIDVQNILTDDEIEIEAVSFYIDCDENTN